MVRGVLSEAFDKVCNVSTVALRSACESYMKMDLGAVDSRLIKPFYKNSKEGKGAIIYEAVTETVSSISPTLGHVMGFDRRCCLTYTGEDNTYENFINLTFEEASIASERASGNLMIDGRRLSNVNVMLEKVTSNVEGVVSDGIDLLSDNFSNQVPSMDQVQELFNEHLSFVGDFVSKSGIDTSFVYDMAGQLFVELVEKAEPIHNAGRILSRILSP